MTDDGFPYSVHYNGDYRFDVKKINGEWFLKSIRKVNQDRLDENLASIIIKELESRQL